jgi:threonine dehydrogenase-like Zn-dependent dehydrogenase
MWTSTLKLDPAHVIPTKLLGLIWSGAYFSSFAPLQVQNLPRQPLPASNWVRVRNSLAGICGSDLHLIFADGDFTVAPAAIPSPDLTHPGHEVVGEVIEVGNDVQRIHVGDRVVLQYGPNCITAGIQHPCRSCSTGHYGLCEYGALPGPSPIGGGWSEEMLLHEQQLFRLPADINDMQAVLLEPSAVAVHAVLRYIPQAKERVLIIGAGTIGLLILQVVRTLAPDAEVSVMARHAFQIEQAARLGAHIIYPRDSYREVQRATGAKFYQGMGGNKMLLGGYDVIYDTISNNRTTNDALRWARAGSTVVMVGLNLHKMQLDLTPIWYQEINLIGTTGHGIETWPIGSYERKSTFEITAELIQNKRLFPDKLITHSFPLSGYRDALMTAANKDRNRAIKVVFDYSKQPPSVVPNVRAAARQHQRAITIPFDSHPSQPLAPVESGLSPAPSLPWTEEETPYGVPTPDQAAPPWLSTPDIPTMDIPPTPPSSNEVDTGVTDRVPIITPAEEDEDSDTIIVSAPKHAKAAVETPAIAPSTAEQEEHIVLDSAAASIETEAHPLSQEVPPSVVDEATAFSEPPTASVETEAEPEHLLSLEVPPTEVDEAAAFSEPPTTPVSEEDGTWLQSYSLLPTGEEPTWLQPLPPSQDDEEPTWSQPLPPSHSEAEPTWLQSLTTSQSDEEPAWLQSFVQVHTEEDKETTHSSEASGHTDNEEITHSSEAPSYTDDEEITHYMEAPSHTDNEGFTHFSEAPGHTDNEETIHFSEATSYIDEGPDSQFIAPTTGDSNNDDTKTIIFSPGKRYRSKQKKSELKNTRRQKSPKAPSEQAKPLIVDNQEQQSDPESEQ